MNSEELFRIFSENLLDRLASGITNSFRSKFISEVEQKRDRLCLKDEALAMDIAAHCNLCGELKLPLYFQDNILKTKVDLGLDYFTDRMLEECNRALENHVFTVINIEETEADRVKFTYKMAHFPSESFCTMIPKYPEFIFNKYTASQCKTSESWIRFYTYNNITKHVHGDTGLIHANDICDSHYCVILCMCVLYYIKYILNEYDFYLCNRNRYMQSQIKEPVGEIENMEQLKDQIENPRMNHLYAFLQSESGLDQMEMYTYIAQQLHKNNKISSPTYYCYDMINLADQLAKNPSGVKYEYSTLERDNLYFVTGLDDFFKSFDYNSIMYEKKCQHIVSILSQIRENRYVIIVGDKNDLRKFLDLNPRIDFLYKELPV